MWTEDLECRAARMRERNRRAATAAPDSNASRGRSAPKTSAPPSSAPTHPAIISVPGVPEVRPYALLRELWKPAHTKALLDALGDVDSLVTRSARSIGKQQVGFDGLISLGGAGVLGLAAPLARSQALAFVQPPPACGARSRRRG